MNLQKLEKATKILEQIKAIDAEIVSLEKIAIQLSNGQGVKLNIEVEIPSEEKKPNVFDEHGFIKDEFKGEKEEKGEESAIDTYIRFSPLSFLSGVRTGTSEKSSNKIDYESKLSDTDSLTIISVLMFRKNQQRQVLINKIEKLSL